MNNKVAIIGIDLAWGSKNPMIKTTKNDGVCVIEADRYKYKILELAHVSGDESLINLIIRYKNQYKRSLIMIDAPIICNNKTGMRPVDKLTHRIFNREHAACHPANSTKCSRPIRIAEELKKLGIKIGWDIRAHAHLVAEVYPHPAMVRLFRLNKIFKYKKGKKPEKIKEFRRYQKVFKDFLDENFQNLELNKDAKMLFKAQWDKPNEDKLDALFCGILGMWHYIFSGRESEIIGNRKSGFILLPVDLRKTNLKIN